MPLEQQRFTRPLLLMDKLGQRLAAAHDIKQAIVNPRTTLLQSLEAILVTELTDNSCWEALIELARQAGEEALVEPFQEALENEQDHLVKVQAWVAAGQGWPWNGGRDGQR